MSAKVRDTNLRVCVHTHEFKSDMNLRVYAQTHKFKSADTSTYTHRQNKISKAYVIREK